MCKKAHILLDLQKFKYKTTASHICSSFFKELQFLEKSSASSTGIQPEFLHLTDTLLEIPNWKLVWTTNTNVVQGLFV